MDRNALTSQLPVSIDRIDNYPSNHIVTSFDDDDEEEYDAGDITIF